MFKRIYPTKPLAKRKGMPFHERFGMDLDQDEAKRRFLNRITNVIFHSFCATLGSSFDGDVSNFVRAAANKLGEEWSTRDFMGHRVALTLDDLVRGDFVRCLQALEAIFDALEDSHWRSNFNDLIVSILGETEVDLGIRWKNGRFSRTGAEMLDKDVVEKPLRWLKAKGYEGVLVPFRRALVNFGRVTDETTTLPNAVADLHEAMEALAKKVTGRTSKDLAGNYEIMLKTLGTPDEFKDLFRWYVKYANSLARHAGDGTAPRRSLERREVEAFLYLTGTLIRFIMEES